MDLLKKTKEMNDATSQNPLTGIIIVSDKARCPTQFYPITKTYDDQTEADIWKESFFSLSRTYRYFAVCKEIPANAFVLNVVADVCIVPERDIVPNGFVPIEYTEDTRERALRKKQLCVRSVPRDTAVDAVCDLIVCSRLKKPPVGYSLAGEVDGLTVCYKYGVIPPNFGTGVSRHTSMYPNVPSLPSRGGEQTVGQYRLEQQPQFTKPGQAVDGMQQAAAGVATLSRQASKGVEDLPFELHALIKAAMGYDLSDRFPEVRPVDKYRLDRDFSYNFNLENTTLYSNMN